MELTWRCSPDDAEGGEANTTSLPEPGRGDADLSPSQGTPASFKSMCSAASVVSDSCNPADCSLPGSSVCGILQARILECVAISSSRGSSQPRDQTYVSALTSRFFTTEPPGKPRQEAVPGKKTRWFTEKGLEGASGKWSSFP